MNDWLQARNILAIRLDNMGDVVMLGPALRAVKETSPESTITLLASPAGASIAPLVPEVNDVMVLRSVWQDVGNHIAFDPVRERRLIATLARRRFDAALVFTSFSQTPHTPGYVCYLAGIPLRAGESKEFGGGTLSTELRGAPDTLHQVERNLRLVEHLGYRVRDRQLALAIPDADRATVQALLAERGVAVNEPFVLLHPGASAQARRYPAERYGEVARLLTDAGWQVLVTGVEREAALLQTVLEQAPAAIGLLGATTPGQYAALIERAGLVVCNDTLPMHLADAVRTPVVVLYSGTEYEEQWRPRATPARLLRQPTPCSPCYRFECPFGLPCLDIAPSEVVNAAGELLAAVGIQRPAAPTALAGSAGGTR